MKESNGLFEAVYMNKPQKQPISGWKLDAAISTRYLREALATTDAPLGVPVLVAMEECLGYLLDAATHLRKAIKELEETLERTHT